MAPGKPRQRAVLGAALALVLAQWAFLVPGCGPRDTSAVGGSAAGAADSLVRLPLPDFAPGTTMVQVVTALADWPPGHLFTSDAAGNEGWEWSGSDGRRVEAYFAGGLARSLRVSRTWGTGAPAVDARRLPDASLGRPLRELEASIGPGLLAERLWSVPPGRAPAVTEVYRWAIHDRGVDTGLFLVVGVADGVVVSVRHRWSRT